MEKTQEATWDEIAENWDEFRKVPSPSVVNFLKGKKGKILDFGCGSGRNFLKTRGIIYGVDFSGEMLKLAEKNAKEKKIKVVLKQNKKTEIPYEDNFFDAEICAAVLHCLKPKEQKKVLKEMFRVLKSNSELFVSVWSRQSPRLRNKPKESYIPWHTKFGEQKRYTYIYEPEELEKQVKSAGFKIIKSWQERNINLIVKKN